MTNAISVEDRIDVLLGRCARDRNHMTPITREFLHEIAARLRSHESPEPLAEAAQLAHGMKDAPCFSELLGEVDPDDPYCGCPVCVLRKIAALIPAPEPREP